MSADCLFCKIVAGSIPAKRVFEDELCISFADLRPQAPTHLLIVPRQFVLVNKSSLKPLGNYRFIS